VAVEIGERARDLAVRLSGSATGAWPPHRHDRETLLELSERLDLDLPVDAFRSPDVALAFLQRALRALRVHRSPP
jgi:hypothetical protein